MSRGRTWIPPTFSPPPVPTPTANPIDERRRDYILVLVKEMERRAVNGELDEELADRIERLLGVTAGVNPSRGGEPFLDPATIAKAVMTPEQEDTVRRGCCPKCMGALDASCEADGMRFGHCKPCHSTYATGVSGTPPPVPDQPQQGAPE